MVTRLAALLSTFVLVACPHPSAPVAAESTMNTNDTKSDLDWVNQLVNALATGTFTREQAIAFLGEDAGPDPSHEKGRLVRPRSKLLASASVYPLEHIGTPVAIDVVFAPGSAPTLDRLAARLGPFAPMPRAPDDFTSGDKLAHYVERAGSKTSVRVFAELDRESKHVAKLFFDAYTSP